MSLIGGIYNLATGPIDQIRGMQNEQIAKNELIKQKNAYNQNTQKFGEELQGQVDQGIQQREGVLNAYNQYAQTGLSEEAKSLYSDLATRGMSTSIGATRDRRGGLAGIGSMNQTFLDSAREISSMDAELQKQRMQEALGYRSNMTESNIRDRSIPLQYQIGRSEGMENREFSEIDADLDYARAMIGAGKEKVASGIDSIGSTIEQGAAIYLTGGLSGMGGDGVGSPNPTDSYSENYKRDLKQGKRDLRRSNFNKFWNG